MNKAQKPMALMLFATAVAIAGGAAAQTARDAGDVTASKDKTQAPAAKNLLDRAWLRDLLGQPRSMVPSTSGSSGGIVTESISEMPLSGSGSAGVGILTPEQAGLPDTIWAGADAAELARHIAPFRPTGLPEVTALWHRMALLAAPSPEDAGDVLLAARVDHLVRAGALDQAEALLEAAPIRTAALFRRAFDVGLLTGRAESACDAMRAKPRLAPGLKARIFCLARAGDWGAAAITLTSAETLGQITPEDAALLGRFLDPELFEDDPAPPPARPMPAIDHVMREALALPRGAGALPLAFLHPDLDITAPWRNRVVAMERLVRSRAVPPARLIQLYQDGTPAASGGVWVRVAAVQRLLGAIRLGDAIEMSDALVAADQALGAAGLRFALGDLAAGPLRDTELLPAAARVRFELWLLHPSYADLVWDHTPVDDWEATLQAVAVGRAEDLSPQDDLTAAVRAGLTRSDLRDAILFELDRGRPGIAILKALDRLVDARHRDPVAVEVTLAVLRRAGAKDEARRIALEVMILAGGRR